MKSWEFMTDRKNKAQYQPPDDVFVRREHKAQIDIGTAHAEWQEKVVDVQLKQQELELNKLELEKRDREVVQAMADRSRKRSRKI